MLDQQPSASINRVKFIDQLSDWKNSRKTLVHEVKKLVYSKNIIIILDIFGLF